MEHKELSHIKPGNYILISGAARKDKRITGNSELLCFSLLSGFSQTPGNYLRGGQEYIAEWLNLTPSNVSKLLKRMEEKGLIGKVVINQYGCVKKYGYYALPLSPSALDETARASVKTADAADAETAGAACDGTVSAAHTETAGAADRRMADDRHEQSRGFDDSLSGENKYGKKQGSYYRRNDYGRPARKSWIDEFPQNEYDFDALERDVVKNY
jgi:hypothetical protein